MADVIGDVTIRSDHDVEWRIENFSSYMEGGNKYTSPRFTISGMEWCLGIGKNGKILGWFSLRCSANSGTSSSDAVRITFGVKKMDGKVEQINSNHDIVFDKDSSACSFHGVMDYSELLRRFHVMSSDVFQLTCNFRTEKDLKFCARMGTLSKDLVDLFTSKRYSDATLVVQGKEFAVHRSILSARCSVFATMFEVDMKEKRTGVVEISDCDPHAFDEFLLYLYSGNLDVDSCNGVELFKIAHKYDLQELKSFCYTPIISKLSTENVLDVMVLGVTFDDLELMDKAQTFFNDNFPKIVSTPKWDAFLENRLTIANTLIKGMAKKMEA